MQRYFCPFLNAEVELTDERQGHIKIYHPDLIPYFGRLADVIQNPEEIRKSLHDEEVIMLYKFYSDILNGKYLVVVIKRGERNFILTSYLTSKIRGGQAL